MERELAVNVDALVTRMLFPALRVRGLDPPDEIVPAPAKPKAVSETDIVSRDETEESAPLFMTIPLIVLVEVGAYIVPPTFKVPPTVALLVTSSPVPEAVKRDDPEKVLADVPVWV